MEKLFTMSHRKSIFSSAAVFSVGQIGAKMRQFRGKIQTKRADEEIFIRPEINQFTAVVFVS